MRKWWISAFALLLVTASGVLAVMWFSTPSVRVPSASLKNQLEARVVEALEQDPGFRTEVTEEPGRRPICVASVFGMAPSSTDTVDDVRTVYTWVDCAWVGPGDLAKGPAGLHLNQLPGLGTPIALQLGPPVTYRAPDDGENYPDSVRRIFPGPLRDAAFSRSEESARDVLQQRILRLAASATASPSPSHS